MTKSAAQSWISPAATVLTLVIGAVAFAYNYDLTIRANERRSKSNEVCVKRLEAGGEAVRLELRELKTIQGIQTRRLERMDTKLDKIQELLTRRAR